MFIAILSALMLMSPTISEKTLFDFTESSSANQWNIVNDGVMGGLSTSSFQWQEGGKAKFSGNVALENYGGFASVRSTPTKFQLEGYTGIQLRVKGDGKSFKFRIRTNDYFDGVAYSIDFFAPDNEWVDVRLKFEDFKPTFRGRVLPDVEPLAPEKVMQLGLLIADKQEGAFELVIDSIVAYSN